MNKITKHWVIKHLNRVLLSIVIPMISCITMVSAEFSDIASFKSVKPFFSPDNQINANLLLLIDRQSETQYFGTNEIALDSLLTQNVLQSDNMSTSENHTEGDKSTKNNNTNKETTSKVNTKIDGLPAGAFFLTDQYLAEQTKENKKIQSELEQFGVVESQKSLLALSNLKKFNQTVVQDTLIDNVQKQLLIGLRGSLFSYHFREPNEDDQTLTTDEIITKRIRELPDSDRIGEYKRYLLALDAFKNNNLTEAQSLYQSLVNAKHSWIAQSANYMLIEISILNYNSMPVLDDAIDKSTSNTQQAAEQIENQTNVENNRLAKLHEIENLVNAYQKLYPAGDYLNQAKMALFKLYQEQTDEEIKSKSLDRQASYFDVLLQNQIEYDAALSLQGVIVEDVLSHFPFITKNSKGKLSANQSYELQPNHPMLDFINTLSLLSSIKDSGLSQKALLARSLKVAQALEEIGLNSLSHYLKIEADWRINQDSEKTLAAINELNLDMQQANKNEIFALYMIQSQAYLKAKREEEAVALWTELQKSPLTPAQKTFLELKLN
ncbi:hypothetical protein [Thorsellia anophelis]|uniref:Uncharacterized protein n=1 Tax=Thorsellia anophelis DSM 18579 TaxID=1123402 RepID=A0A1I0A732_9GAMM|nr:hypothetical protein [Thorsellia anophelis]SES89498.1 hypothetical protein SAMN02583745_00800 [Thorsellia anophelis DSM 18579]